MFSDKDITVLEALLNRKRSNNSIELETRITQSVESNQFVYLSKKLSELNYERVDNPEYMNISLQRDERSNLFIRYTIDGLDNIRAYCKMEDVNNPRRLYKSRLFWNSTEMAKLREQGLSETDYNTKDMSHYIKDYNIKFNCKMEVDIDKDDTNSDAKMETERLDRAINEIGWSNLLKVFRFIKRTSFYTPDRKFRIDLSVVKSNKKTYSLSGFEYVMATKSFKESGTLNSTEQFEIEIEYIGDISKDTNANIIQDFKKHNTNILSHLFYESLIPISKSLTSKIIDEYTTTIQKMLLSGIETYKQSHSERIDALTKIETQLKRMKPNKKNLLKYFYVPKVMSMLMENLHESYPINILKDYTVTDKADGVTAVLFISKDQKGLYMLDSNMLVYCLDENFQDDSIGNTIIAGEFVKSSTPTIRSQFLAFDIYVHNSIDTRFLPLISGDVLVNTRVKNIKDVLAKISITTLTLKCKEFEFGDNIFALSKKIWDNRGKYDYKLDGLIYTPQNHPVGYLPNNHDYFTKMGISWALNIKWKPSEDNTIDFLVVVEKERIEIDKQRGIYMDRDKITYKTVLEDAIMKFIPYKTLHLYCGFKVTPDYNPCMSTHQSADKMFDKYIPTKFTPTTPYNENGYIAHIRCDDSGQNIYGVNDKTKIVDNTIVEFSYNMSAKSTELDEFSRWVPLRTRLDITLQYNNAVREKERIFRIFTKYIKESKYKSASYKFSEHEVREVRELEFLLKLIGVIGRFDDPPKIIAALHKNSKRLTDNIKTSMDIPIPIRIGNNYDTANSIWKSMHFPITEKIITTGTDIPSLENEEVVYYNRDISRDKSLTFNMQQFHNKIVKNIILYKRSVELIREHNKTGELHMLELASGKIGDLYKWQSNKIHNVVAVDNVRNNIYDMKDGACKRYVDFKKRAELVPGTFVPKVKFLLGDVSKNIKSGLFAMDTATESEFNNLWNNGPKYVENGFDIISIQFAMHYMFSDETSLDNLLININDCLKPNGYLIGTIMDGSKIYSRLYDKKVGETLEGLSKEGKLMWRIRKQYENSMNSENKFLDDKNYKLGMGIDVYLHSINQSIREYLISFPYLQQKLEKYSIELVETHEFGNIHMEYRELPEYKFLLEMSSEKEFSFLNKTFIFQKSDAHKVRIRNIYNYIADNIYLHDIAKVINDINSHRTSDISWGKLYIYLNTIPAYKIDRDEDRDMLRSLITNKLDSGELIVPDIKKPERTKKTTVQVKKDKATKGKTDIITELLMEDKKLSGLSEEILAQYNKDERANISTLMDRYNKNKKSIDVIIKKTTLSSISDDKLKQYLDLVNKILPLFPSTFEQVAQLKVINDDLITLKNKLEKQLGNSTGTEEE